MMDAQTAAEQHEMIRQFQDANPMPVDDEAFRPNKPHMTIVEQVYYQSPGMNPESVTLQFGLMLESREQPYVRHTEIGEQWQPIEKGWVQEASMVVLVNDHENNRLVMPSESEKADRAKQIIEVGVKSGDDACRFAKIPPGHSLRLEPFDIDTLRVRSASGTIQFSLSIFPK